MEQNFVACHKKKLSCSIGLLSKIRHYVPKHLLQTIYHSIFNSYLIYAWFTKLLKLQNKPLKERNFQVDSPTDPHYQGRKVLKIADFINYENALFVKKKRKPTSLP